MFIQEDGNQMLELCRKLLESFLERATSLSSDNDLVGHGPLINPSIMG